MVETVEDLGFLAATEVALCDLGLADVEAKVLWSHLASLAAACCAQGGAGAAKSSERMTAKAKAAPAPAPASVPAPTKKAVDAAMLPMDIGNWLKTGGVSDCEHKVPRKFYNCIYPEVLGLCSWPACAYGWRVARFAAA
jgi:hypothetical protein